MTSIFSSQNLQTFRRRKYCFLPPGAPAPPSRLPERSLDPDSLRAAAIVIRSLLAPEGEDTSAPPPYGRLYLNRAPPARVERRAGTLRMNSARLHGVHRLTGGFLIEIDATDHRQRVTKAEPEQDPIFQCGSELLFTSPK